MIENDESPPPNRATKSTDNTVFVRFVPPCALIRRHHVVDVFSEIGPIKKSSIIHARDKNNPDVTSSSYGFIRYTSPEDAALAAIQLNNRSLTVESQTVSVQVTLAKKGTESNQKDRRQEPSDPDRPIQKTNRLIVRNLSFYATEKDVRKALSPFGTLSEIHIPTVGKTKRGFCFVMFEETAAAKKCLQAKEDAIIIKDRPVKIARALHKTAYESARHTPQPSQSSTAAKDATVSSKETVDNGAPKETNTGTDDDESMDDPDDNAEESDGEEESVHDAIDDSASRDNTAAVAEKRCLFLRNLPFDVTRHEIFEVFRHYGHVDSIFIVKDRETGKIPRGTAFVTFQTAEQAAKALADSSGGSESSIHLKGRDIYSNWAVDKETATTLSETKTIISKDRRNLYLKGEGRVDNSETNRAWDALPESDQLKRQTAWSDKNTKLKSPLFFINPKRLSVRNLAKHVDESQFKRLIVQAVQQGLKKNLVSLDEQIAHWKATGEMSIKEILEAAKTFVMPQLDDKNIRHCIPGIHIHRDYQPGAKKREAPSRGFGFVDFHHHIHALACLRELNNNKRYSAEYATGGKFASIKQLKPSKRKRDVEDVKVPGLIVEFTVENLAKAKQQEQHRAQQKANFIKQKQQNQDSKQKEPKKRKSRGAAQREKKRRQKEQGLDSKTVKASKDADIAVDLQPAERDRPEPHQKEAVRKPPKKQPKVDEAEEKFAKLVETYKQEAASLFINADSSKMLKDKRWFEE